jgi:hypothetical protein
MAREMLLLRASIDYIAMRGQLNASSIRYMRPIMRLSLCLAGIFLLFTRASALAAPILDQEFVPPGTASVDGVISNQFASFVDQAQTFTVGITGNLVGLQLYLYTNTTTRGAIVDLRPTLAGIPVNDDNSALIGALVASSSIPSLSFPTFVTIDLSASPLAVVAGQELAISIRGALRGFDDGSFNIRGDLGNPYGSGAAFSRTNATVDWFQSCAFGDCGPASNQIDFGFRTFVEPAVAAIPEPSTMLLVGVGTAWGLRRRRCRTVVEPVVRANPSNPAGVA